MPATESVATAASVPAAISSNGIYPETQAEALAKVVPVNLTYPPGRVERYGADIRGGADSTAALNDALKSNSYVCAVGGTFRISAPLVLHSSQVFEAFGGATLFIATSNCTAVTATAISNVTVRNWVINGNGSTGAGGNARTNGIVFDGVVDFLIDGCVITSMGNMNVADPGNDAHNGGFGIIIQNNAAPSFNGVISRCTISQIAGGGRSRGDGIIINKWAGSPRMSDITVRDCYVSTCGRDCYSIATSTGQPTDIKLINCYGEKSAAAGVDIEDAQHTLIEGCHFRTCGNDRTFFNPAAIYGTSYRLLAGVGTGNEPNFDNVIRNCHFDGCYFGVTFGASRYYTLESCRFENSVIADATMGEAAAPAIMRVRDCHFLSKVGTLFGYNAQAGDNDVLFSGCTFARPVKFANGTNVSFEHCTFLMGMTCGYGSARIRWNECHFVDFAGVAIDTASANAANSYCSVTRCVFAGAGNMMQGVGFGFNSAAGWTIDENQFVGLTTAGIHVANGGGKVPIASCRGNTFTNCAGGILIITQAITGGVFSANLFSATNGWCMRFAGIATGEPMQYVTITDNIFGGVNGLQIEVSTGSWDYCVVMGNNAHACTGTKWSLSAGNSDGVTANNITT
jgi:hypothetical protein